MHLCAFFTNIANINMPQHELRAADLFDGHFRYHSFINNNILVSSRHIYCEYQVPAGIW
jgi:hypothetical protein